jgi:hypothetical protein
MKLAARRVKVADPEGWKAGALADEADCPPRGKAVARRMKPPARQEASPSLLTDYASRRLMMEADRRWAAMPVLPAGVGKGLTRPQVLTRGAALGVGIPLAGGLLDACANSANSARAGSSSGIVVGLDTDIDTLDPISFRSPAAYATVIQAYEMPVTNQVQFADGILDGVAGALAPDVAVGYSIAADRTEYKFTVRPHVTFSNGDPVNADVLRYSYLRALEGPGYAAELMKLLTVSPILDAE